MISIMTIYVFVIHPKTCQKAQQQDTMNYITYYIQTKKYVKQLCCSYLTPLPTFENIVCEIKANFVQGDRS